MNDDANWDAGHGSVAIATAPSPARARLAIGPLTATTAARPGVVPVPS